MVSGQPLIARTGSDRGIRRGTYRRLQVETGQESVSFEGPNWEMRGPVGPSPDGKAVFYTKAPESSSAGGEGLRLVRRDLETGKETELYRMDGGPLFLNPSVSPDGKRLALIASSGPDHQRVLITISASGDGSPFELARGSYLPTVSGQTVWTRDGRYILVAVNEGDTSQRVWAFPAEGGAPRKLNLTMTKIQLTDVSPDGRQLMFTGTVTKPEIWTIKNFLHGVK